MATLGDLIVTVFVTAAVWQWAVKPFVAWTAKIHGIKVVGRREEP